MLALLEERFRVIAFDNRGAGRSDKPEGDYTIPQAAADASGLMDALGLGRTHVLGISMGGMIAQEIAISYPERVEKLVLVCTNSGGKQQALDRPEIIKVLGAPRQGDMPIEQMAREYLRLLYSPEFIASHPEKVEEFVRVYTANPPQEHGFVGQLQAVLKWDSSSRLYRIKCPTLVLTGDEDVLVPAEESVSLAERITDARLIVYPGVGHGIFGQITEQATRDIIAFLEE
jgi:pimeloyl-ACP methyl ester carboxylesterase